MEHTQDELKAIMEKFAASGWISLPCRPKSGSTEAVIKHPSSLPLSRRIGSAEAVGANLTRFIRGRLPYRARYKPRMKADGRSNWSHSF